MQGHHLERRLVWSTLLATLTWFLHDDIVSPPPPVGTEHEDALAAVAREHGVGALVAEALRTAGQPVPDGLADEAFRGAARHLRTLEDLARVGEALDGAQVRWLVAKGPVLASVWFGRPYLRAYDDLDVYVTPADFSAAMEVLLANGGTVLDTDVFLRRVMPGEVRVQVGTDAAVDLHWQPFFYQVHARRFPVGVESMLERARHWEADDGGDVLVPSMADGLVHLCLHASISGGGRLSWLVDIDRYLASWHVGADAIREAVHRWHAGAAVALMLARTDAVLGSSESRRLLDALPGAVSVSARCAERLWGRGQVDGPLRTAATRAAGESLSETLWWASRAGARRVLPRLEARRAAPPAQGDYFDAVRELGGGSASTSS